MFAQLSSDRVVYAFSEHATHRPKVGLLVTPILVGYALNVYTYLLG